MKSLNRDRFHDDGMSRSFDAQSMGGRSMGRQQNFDTQSMHGSMGGHPMGGPPGGPPIGWPPIEPCIDCVSKLFCCRPIDRPPMD